MQACYRPSQISLLYSHAIYTVKSVANEYTLYTVSQKGTLTLSIVALTRRRSVERGICPIAAVCTVLLSRPRPHRKLLSGVMSGLSLGTRLPDLKFVSSAVLELLAFNAQKFTGSRDRDHAHFLETFIRGHVGTIPENTPAKFEVRIYSRFGAIGI